MPPKRKPEVEEPVDPADEFMFFGLGGCNEVGRSCHIIKYRGKTVMLDAGMHPAFDGHAALPFYDEYDLSTIDILLISHFHVDHAASLPYVLAKTNFKGRVFMTHPTKAIYKWLIQDSVRLGTMSSSEHKVQLYNEADHLATYPMIEPIDYYTTHTVSSISITPYPAGHVLGAAMFLIEIAGLKILFTGDYSREEDRHLVSAVPPANVKVDILITESTYGTATHTPRMERENLLMKTITGILNRGGRALLPVFALGRAQELLLILDEYWSKHPEYQNIPIYYASNLARKCMTVYQTYISAMNDNIKTLFRDAMSSTDGAGLQKLGPWDFRHVRSLKSLDRFEDVGPCVMLASPGMMQNGISRRLLEQWAPDSRNGVVVTGYSVEGTMAKLIMTEPEFITPVMTKGAGAQSSRTGALGQSDQIRIPRRCSINEYSFAAHVDGNENREFVEEISPAVVILVHGKKAQMTRFKSKLLGLNAKRKVPIKVFSPPNCEELRIPFKTDKLARVVGKLAETIGQAELDSLTEINPRTMTGVLVQNDFKLSFMAPEDLKDYAGLMTTQITCRHRMKLYSASPYLIRWALEGAFGKIKDVSVVNEEKTTGVVGEVADSESIEPGTAELATVKKEGPQGELERRPRRVPDQKKPPVVVYEIMDCVRVQIEGRGDVTVEWEGNMMNDGVADAVVASLMSLESSPAALKISSQQHRHHNHHGDDADDTEAMEAALKESRNPFAELAPTPRLSILLGYLEAQFGAESVTPLARPRLKPGAVLPAGLLEAPSDTDAEMKDGTGSEQPKQNDESGQSDESPETATESKPDPDGAVAQPDQAASKEQSEAAAVTTYYRSKIPLTFEEMDELKRLHSIGVPVPGIEIEVDTHLARVWLEDLSVECDYALLTSRVKAVVERGIELGASLN